MNWNKDLRANNHALPALFSLIQCSHDNINFRRQNINAIIINSDFFEKISHDYYRLKVGASASAAIRDLLNGERNHVIDCTAALSIAQYSALMLTLGDEKFDRIFGQASALDNLTPEDRRIIISPHLELMGHSKYGVNLLDIAEINPLLYFFDYSEAAKQRGGCPIECLAAASMVYFKGHIEYTNKHVCGAFGGWNAVYSGENTFLGFGFSRALSTEETASGANRAMSALNSSTTKIADGLR